MKICDIVQFYSPLGGGVQRYIRDKARLFEAMPDVEHRVILPARQDVRETWHASAVYGLPSLPLIGSNSYRVLLSRQRILQILREQRPDLIEVDNPYHSAWTALKAKETLGIPVVAFYHSDFPRALGRTARRFTGAAVERMISAPFQRYVVNLYNRMDATVVASRRMESLLRACGVDNVVRIPLGTDVERFAPAPDAQQVRQELGLHERDFLILFVGRLAREKNILSMLRMMRHLAADSERGVRYHLLLVGDGELRRIVRNRVRGNPHVTWRQYCTSVDELNRYYTAADVFLHAGNFETFGITSLEAQACGTRVIAVRGGGVDDTVDGEAPPIMARSPDPDDLADAIRCARAVQGGASPAARRQRIVENFSLQGSVGNLLQLYRHILSAASVEEFSIEPRRTVLDSHADTTLYPG